MRAEQVEYDNELLLDGNRDEPVLIGA